MVPSTNIKFFIWKPKKKVEKGVVTYRIHKGHYVRNHLRSSTNLPIFIREPIYKYNKRDINGTIRKRF